MTTTPRIIYLNGQFLPLQEARISVMDRGFLFGDGVYEVIPMFNGKLFRAKEHLKRLKISLEAIHLTVPIGEKTWLDLFEQLIDYNPSQGENRAIYLQLTRGAPENRTHALPEEAAEATIFAQCTPISVTDKKTFMQGAKAITAPDIRWANCYIKAITLLPNVLLAQQAKEANAAEVIMIRNGIVTEGFASNVLIVKKGSIITPPADHSILHGITRDLVLKIAREQDIPFYEQTILETALRNADEVWITSSTKEILPITQIDNYPVGDGKVGPMWQKVFKHYQAYKSINY
jgi:D-alanine transaminase